MRKPSAGLLPPVALAFAFTACTDSRASDSAAAATNAAAEIVPAPAAAPAIHYVRAATDPYPRNGYCTLGACTWFEARGQQRLGSSEHERQLRVTLATGRSAHPDDRYPADAAGVAVRWTGTEEAYVFCSPWRPAVRRLRGGRWQQARADLVGGMGAFGASTRSIYGLVCHLGEDWTEAGFFARHGYRPQRGAAVIHIARPEESTFIHPHDPDRPDMGGIAVSHSPSPAPVTVRLDVPPPSAIDARPIADRAGHFEMLAADADGMLHPIAGPFASAAECEQARAERWRRDRSPTHCAAGERRATR